jgi:hypothetical protein
MRGFGYKTGWLAVRRGDIQGVATVLGGRIAGSVTWEEGIAASYGEPSMLAVTPLLRGADDTDWLLVTGSWIASEAESLDVGALSLALGIHLAEPQSRSTNVRQLGEHARRIGWSQRCGCRTANPSQVARQDRSTNSNTPYIAPTLAGAEPAK